MNKAFIFDLDGVLIDDEQMWENKKQIMYKEFFGDRVHSLLGSTIGINIDGIYERAVAAGADADKDKFVKEFYKLASDIYSTAPIPEGVEELAQQLRKLKYRIGIVSASPMPWITTVTKRLLFENDIELIISLHEREDLEHKPKPDGYIHAMQELESTPDTTIVLEDSMSGIKSARASGAYTIGLQQNLVEGYVQEGANAYAATMLDVISLVNARN